MNRAAPMNLPSRKLTWAMRVLSLVALSISGYLAWSAYQQSEVVGCGGGAIWDCGHVLHSRWSKWLGMPVSLPAVGIYVSVLFALAICGAAKKQSTKHIAWAVVTVACLSAGIAAMWFISLQAFVLKKLCVYCMCAHGCGIVLSGIILWRRPLGKKMTSALSGLSVLGACVLIFGQVVAPTPKTYAEERYDEIDFASSDGEVFAVEGIESEQDSDEFLIAPIEEMLPPTEDASPDSTPELNISELPVLPSDATSDATTSNDDLADFVSKYSMKLAEDIRDQLRTVSSKAVDSIVLSNDVEPIREIDAMQFEPVSADSSTQPIVEANPYLESARSSTGLHATIPSNEFQRSLEEIAQDLADIGGVENSGAKISQRDNQRSVAASQQLATTSAPQEDQQAEAKSIAVVGESMGVRNTKPVESNRPTQQAIATLRQSLPIRPYQFARDASILVHDVPQHTDNASPTPTATPIPQNSAAVETAKAETKNPTRNLVAVLGGRAKLDSRHWPLIGDTKAKYVLVELFDYTCPHCRKMNQHIQAARQRYGNDLSIMTLPVPLSQECNDTVASTKVRHQAACELARLSVAVWRINPEAYETFHEWLFIPEHGRNTGEAWSYASQLVGNDLLRQEMAKPTVNQFISKHVELYKRAGQGTVPKLMFPKVTIRGEMNTPEALYSVLERELFSAN